MLWGGMLGTCAVWGICFRLTFWELSWDVMEPVTYFIGSGLGQICNTHDHEAAMSPCY